MTTGQPFLVAEELRVLKRAEMTNSALFSFLPLSTVQEYSCNTVAGWSTIVGSGCGSLEAY